jgi:hypothetical protein
VYSGVYGVAGRAGGKTLGDFQLRLAVLQAAVFYHSGIEMFNGGPMAHIHGWATEFLILSLGDIPGERKAADIKS